jgi:hypothetical protein
MEQVPWIKCKSLDRTCSCSCSSKNCFSKFLCALFSPRLDSFTASLESAFFPLRKTKRIEPGDALKRKPNSFGFGEGNFWNDFYRLLSVRTY